jgi:hypothetical protein
MLRNIDSERQKPHPCSVPLRRASPILVIRAAAVCCAKRRGRHGPRWLGSCPLRVHREHARHTDPDPPGSSRPDAYGASCAGSPRTPSRLDCRAREVWRCRRAPSLSGLLPTLTGVPRLKLPPASPHRYDGGATRVSTPIRKTAPRAVNKGPDHCSEYPAVIESDCAVLLAWVTSAFV